VAGGGPDVRRARAIAYWALGGSVAAAGGPVADSLFFDHRDPEAVLRLNSRPTPRAG
jgi:hypothetical protein